MGSTRASRACGILALEVNVMTWLDVLAPVMVIGLMALLFLAIVSSEGVSRHRRNGPFPPMQRDIAATSGLWRRRWRRQTPWTEDPSPPS
jgi:hypothetical protein